MIHSNPLYHLLLGHGASLVNIRNPALDFLTNENVILDVVQRAVIGQRGIAKSRHPTVQVIE